MPGPTPGAPERFTQRERTEPAPIETDQLYSSKRVGEELPEVCKGKQRQKYFI
jgi:hypothetical protein